ncbi:hypothetical protein FACS1894166_13370 [Bacilli bacterium]|nr:hypothetical protein FACS1894166_13370 [Bacilli bacterium]
MDLGKESFKSNPYLTEVKIIGDNRITLGKECFNDCYSLKDIDLSKTDVN